MTIRRYSSRTRHLDTSFLLPRLQQARSYKRIAGYFTSSLFEVADELLERIPEVKIVCNVDIHPDDLRVAKLRESKMIGRWNEMPVEAEALLNRERYRRLDAFLRTPGHAVRVTPDAICGFVHGKAGVIEMADGSKLGFIGSLNETRNGWQRHYEILWEDDSPEGIKWIEEEFEYLWNAAHPLPEAILREVRRRGFRHEVIFDKITGMENVAPAALVESPMYREGLSLQPWQQGFVAECLRHYRLRQTARLLLADEVGLGKTLSLGAAALTLCLLDDRAKKPRRPVAIFAPATLCEQWQTEMVDKLGVACARWDTARKMWLSPEGGALSPVGCEQVAKCPLRIGVVSTGLLMRDSPERRLLKDLRFGLVILDEAHKARARQGIGKGAGEPNELLKFMLAVAEEADHVLLGTATPIQTRLEDLWDLLRILDQGKGKFVLGNGWSPWHKPELVLPILAGKRDVDDPAEAWDLLRSPLPLHESTDENRARHLYYSIRADLGLEEERWQTTKPLESLSVDTRQTLESELVRRIAGASFFQRENPLVRHIVLRKRARLEEANLLDKVGVNVHPDRSLASDTDWYDKLFVGLALRTKEDFREAYRLAREFGRALGRRGRGAGFMKNLMQQRMCSSIKAGEKTAYKLLHYQKIHEEEDERDVDLALETAEERSILQLMMDRLSNIKVDPKLNAVTQYLDRMKWLERYGCIIFSQYYDTAKWVADELADRYPNEAIGLYAGAGLSLLYRQGESVSCERSTLKRMVAEREIRIMVATDAACEGLNLQTLGALINIDLPWNPTRLEQRLGRIKRFGQTRQNVDMLNLVNEQTVDEEIYKRLSERMRDRYDLFGSIPDSIKDEWIDDVETLGEKMDEYINAQKEATGFDLRYTATMESSEKDWSDCVEVLSRQNFAEVMSVPWSAQTVRTPQSLAGEPVADADGASGSGPVSVSAPDSSRAADLGDSAGEGGGEAP